MTRIRGFLLLDEIQESDVSHENTPPEFSISVANASFGWTLYDPTIRDLSLDIEKGKLVAS